MDIFFRALAEWHDSRAVSVILSGMGADGSMGMKRVKEKGGIVIVQAPREAEYDDMPKNSLAAGLVDYVVEDDGKGFNLRTAIGPKDRGIGLINMRERASFVGGTLEIESKKGVGTTLFVRVPIQEVSHE